LKYEKKMENYIIKIFSENYFNILKFIFRIFKMFFIFFKFKKKFQNFKNIFAGMFFKKNLQGRKPKLTQITGTKIIFKPKIKP